MAHVRDLRLSETSFIAEKLPDSQEDTGYEESGEETGHGESGAKQQQKKTKLTRKNKKSPRKDFSQCSLCSSKGCSVRSEFYCFDCGIMMCFNCNAEHGSIAENKQHITVIIEGDTTAVRQISIDNITCKEHNRLARSFCCQCDHTICHQCLGTSHRGHTCKRISCRTPEQKEQYATLQALHDVKVAELTEKQQIFYLYTQQEMEKLEKIQAQINSHADNMKNMVRAKSSELEARLLHELRVKQDRITELEEEMGRCTTLMTQVQDVAKIAIERQTRFIELHEAQGDAHPRAAAKKVFEKLGLEGLDIEASDSWFETPPESDIPEQTGIPGVLTAHNNPEKMLHQVSEVFADIQQQMLDLTQQLSSMQYEIEFKPGDINLSLGTLQLPDFDQVKEALGINALEREIEEIQKEILELSGKTPVETPVEGEMKQLSLKSPVETPVEGEMQQLSLKSPVETPVESSESDGIEGAVGGIGGAVGTMGGAEGGVMGGHEG